LQHERTLGGVVGSLLKGLVHVRPHLVSRYEVVAEEWMDAWFAAGGANALDAVQATWIADYLADAAPQRTHGTVLAHLLWLGRAREAVG
jgi:hypothetical protein